MIDAIEKAIPILEGCHLEKDGLYHCDSCGEAREYLLTSGHLAGRKVRCICKCIAEQMNSDEKRAREREKQRNRERCFGNCVSEMTGWTFANDDQKNKSLTTACKSYAEDFEERYRKGEGLLLYGDVGSGKSYMAACIANAVLDMGKSVLMSNFSELINRMEGSYADKQAFIDNLNSYSLIVIDDLGIERNTEYMQEQVYNIINTRYRVRKPMIITTNLTMKEMLNPDNLGRLRIYDRLLERNFPIEVSAERSRRVDRMVENYKQQQLF